MIKITDNTVSDLMFAIGRQFILFIVSKIVITVEPFKKVFKTRLLFLLN